MTALAFEVVDARAEPHAAVPTIMLRCGSPRPTAAASTPWPCAARSASSRSAPLPAGGGGALYELFGETPQWGDSLRPFLWTHVSTTVAGFHGSTEFDLPVECTYDFEVAAAKYLHAWPTGRSR